MQIDPAQIERHVAGLGKEPVVYVAAFLLAACIALAGIAVFALQARVNQERRHNEELKGRYDAELERAAADGKRWMQLEHSLRAWLGCVKAGVWELKRWKDGAKPPRPQPLPEDPEEDSSGALTRAFDAPTVATKVPGGGAGHG